MKGFILVAARLVTEAFAQAAETHGRQVPSDIAVPAGNKAFLDAHAVGVQIYSCNATATGHAWTFVAPRSGVLTSSRAAFRHPKPPLPSRWRPYSAAADSTAAIAPAELPPMLAKRYW
jgi:hypothetical protein